MKLWKEKEINGKKEIRLNNYLLDLVEKRKDKKEASIYIKNIEVFVREIWNEIVKNNWRKLQVRKLIPEKLRVHTATFYACKNGKKGISIQLLYKLLMLWKEYCNKTEKEFQEKWDEIFNSNIYFTTHVRTQNTFLPKALTPELCYLVGWLVGDGSFSRKGYVIKINEKCKEQLDKVLRPLIRKLFGIDVPVFVQEKSYKIQFGNKIIYRFLRKVLKVKNGRIPTWIKNSNHFCKSAFLAGIFDAEGWISKKRNRLAISQGKLSFLKEVIKMLKEFNIFPNKPIVCKTKLGKWYFIHIDDKNEFLKFARHIGSNHIEKSKQLQFWVEKIN